MLIEEAITQIEDALRAKFWLLQRTEDVEQVFAEALTTLGWLKTEIEEMREAGEGMYPWCADGRASARWREVAK